MALTFEIITGRGVALHEEDLDRIVLRRREPDYDPGSEVAICPRHGPLLMQTQACEVRLTRHGLTRCITADSGVLEVWKDCVTVVVT
jgi:F0F1-type ATP synthase epsilon subunit